MRLFARSWRPLAAVIVPGLLLAACGASPGAVDEAGSCAGIHFQSAPASVSASRTENVNGDKLVEFVGDISSSEVSAFESRSKLPEFTAGVPSSWASVFWRESGATALLTTPAGNSYVEQNSQVPARWVVIHDMGGGRSRVFVRVVC